jgi:predicted DNA-binding protein (MmcQ/YjbR family)
MGRKKDNGVTSVGQLRAFGLRYPGAHTKSPWPGHLDLAVKDKTFAYLSVDGDPPKISCKLPLSADAALSLPFTEPTPYGLGKSGWVTATFSDDSEVPVELFEQWIDESYRAQAPKRLSASLPEGGPGGASSEPSVTGKAPRAAATAQGGVRASKKAMAASKKATRVAKKAPAAAKKTARAAKKAPAAAKKAARRARD